MIQLQLVHFATIYDLFIYLFVTLVININEASIISYCCAFYKVGLRQLQQH